MNFIYREGAAVAHGPFDTETEARLQGEEQHRLHGTPVHLLAAVDHLTAVPGESAWSNAAKPDSEDNALAGPVYCSCTGLQTLVEMGLIKHQPAQLLDKAGVLHQLSYYHLGPNGRRGVVLAYCPSCGERIQVNDEFTAFAQ